MRSSSRLLFTAAALWIGAAATSIPAAAAEPIDVKLERLEGGKMRLSDLRGEPVLLELWATWCLPCQDQARILHDLRDELERRGVAVLAVNVGEPEKVARAFVADHPSDFPVVFDPWQKIPGMLEVAELPALALLDRTGAVAEVSLGLVQREELLTLLDSVAPAP
jgi:peroxiredoxin